jgi:eukaryotic-like serine/threonine-protein kinase
MPSAVSYAAMSGDLTARPLDRERWQRVSAVLDAAMELPPAARAAYLDHECAGDADLRRQVEELLRADADADAFLAGSASERAAPLVAELADLEAPAAAVGERTVGAYRLGRLLGEGGMGVVYLAERVDGQFDQQVAIKILKHGVPGLDAERRFRQERQILAHLQHPGIARLLDGGVTGDGSPFFVMERVEGTPITEYCDARRLGVEQRLRVFLEVCEAVQYAHQSLVVHRDLKPSNILLDAGGRAKLLDFGIAKILAQGTEVPSGEAGRTALRAMTPEYAAPEQVRGEAVTTATDVYALGVLLYELLAGERPYRVPRGSAAELERAILEQEPARPSDRARAVPGASAKDRARRLRGDLDRIVLQALQKDPRRRYPSAEALANDIRRHLEGQPVFARGDAVTYRLSKFLRRHRLAMSAAALVVLSLVGGLVAATVQARRAQREARKAEAVKNFLQSLFSASNPAEAQGRQRTARDLLDDGARRVETELQEQPEVQSEVARLIAATYQGLGEYDRAASLLRADLERRRRLDGPHSTAAAESLTHLADVLYDQGRVDPAAPLYEEALAIQRRMRGERSPEVAELLWDIAGVKRNRGDLAAAEGLQKQALAIDIESRGEDSREAAAVRESLAITYADGDRYAEAAAMQQPVVAWRERHSGPDHPETLIARYNHATYLLALGHAAEVAQIAEDVAARQRRVLGARHADLATSLRLLARALDASGRSEEARAPIVEAAAIHRESHGPRHTLFSLDVAWEAVIDARSGRVEEARREVGEAIGIVDAHPAQGAIVASIRSTAGGALAEAGDLGGADAQLSLALAGFRALHREGISYGRALDALADVTRRRGHPAHAAELAEQALAIIERSGGAEHPASALARVHLGAAQWAAGRSEAGEARLRSGVASLATAFPAGHGDLATGRFLLGEALARTGRAAEAEPLLMDALGWRQAHFGPADARTAEVRGALARIVRR